MPTTSDLSALRRRIRTLEAGGPRQIELRRQHNRQLRGGSGCDSAEPKDEDAINLLLPNEHHFADHFLMVREVNGFKVGTLNIASGAGSPFEFRIPELDSLYRSVETYYRSPNGITMPKLQLDTLLGNKETFQKIADYYGEKTLNDVFGTRLNNRKTSGIFSTFDNDTVRPTILRTDSENSGKLLQALTEETDWSAKWVDAWMEAQHKLKTARKGVWSNTTPTAKKDASRELADLQLGADDRRAYLFWQFMGDYHQTNAVREWVQEKETGQRIKLIEKHLPKADNSDLPEDLPEDIKKYVKSECLIPKNDFPADKLTAFCTRHSINLMCFSDFNKGAEQKLEENDKWTQVAVQHLESGEKFGAAIYSFGDITAEQASSIFEKGKPIKTKAAAKVTIGGLSYHVECVYLDSGRKTAAGPTDGMGALNDTCALFLPPRMILAGDFNTNTDVARSVYGTPCRTDQGQR